MMGKWLRVWMATGLWAVVAGQGVAAQQGEAWISEVQAPFYFAVSVSDVDRSVEWYRSALGLELIDDTSAEDGRWRIANLSNALVFVEIIRDDRDTAAERATGIAKVGFQVPDLDSVADRVERDTGERPRVLDFERHRIRILQLRDPDGNIVQLSTPIG